MGDSNSEVNVRHRNNPLTKPIIVRMLQNMLHQYNPYVRLFKAAVERMPTSEYKLVIRADKAPQGQHPGTFNAPTINETTGQCPTLKFLFLSKSPTTSNNVKTYL